EPLALTPTASFEGIQQTSSTTPQPDIAAGPDDIIQVVNASIARYSKLGAQTSLQTLQQWFDNLVSTVCPSGAANCRFASPSIRYDSLHGRFLLLVFSTDTFTRRTNFVLSVSNGATFDSGWKNWALQASLNGTVDSGLEVDFPRLGYDNNAVYLTGNM